MSGGGYRYGIRRAAEDTLGGMGHGHGAESLWEKNILRKNWGGRSRAEIACAVNVNGPDR